METMALGLFSAVMLIASVCCLYYKKPLWSFIGSIAAAVLTLWTGYSWKLMLIGSGKDTTLLGFDRYPFALVILCILLLLSAVSMIFSIIRVFRKR